MDIKIKENNNSFHYRVRGIIKQNNKFLIMRVNDDEYYHIPGGHVEIGETSEQAIKREIKEEIGIEINVNKLICVCEQIYEKNDRNFHELVLYYFVTPTIKMKIEDTVRVENDKNRIKKNEFKWITLEEMKELDLRPPLLKDILTDNTTNILHISSKQLPF